ncbi:hypothetical protein ABT369_47315 [Dactylosporangium sp. NPDC000244]|uniref:hypothetical protein n=1 Tax=Dactylosporangium sp. NPDC000244 TaxID=3154365 RepID=UPI003320813C
MSVAQEAGRLIAAAAGPRLAPLGLVRSGRSRLWYADHQWWLTVVEFQPGRSPGTYLNVGAMWLWAGRDRWAFDEGARLRWRPDGSWASEPPIGERGWTEHVGFLNPDQFARDVAVVADIAAGQAAELRRQFPDIHAVASGLISRPARRDESPLWHAFHAGVAAALAGKTTIAEQNLARVAATNSSTGWEHALAAEASEIRDLVGDPAVLREHIARVVNDSRHRLNLPPVRLELGPRP